MNGCRRIAVCTLVLVALGFSAPPPSAAQVTTGAGQTTARIDSLFARAKQLIAAGKSDEGHRMADSIMAAIAPTGNAYGDALYGRASLAASSSDAERDYRQIIVEFPLASHSGDALVHLAQLESSRGDRAAAVGHLQRYWRENVTNPSRASAGLTLARLLLDQNESLQACGVLGQAKTAVADGEVELRNRINFYWNQCAAIVAAARADSIARAAAPADSVKPHVVPPRGNSGRGRGTTVSGKDSSSHTASARYTVQVSAYQTRAEAQQLTDRLTKQGLDAYIQGNQKPFRVRVGHYLTRAEATKAAADMKKKNLNGFVTVVGN